MASPALACFMSQREQRQSDAWCHGSLRKLPLHTFDSIANGLVFRLYLFRVVPCISSSTDDAESASSKHHSGLAQRAVTRRSNLLVLRLGAPHTPDRELMKT